MNTILSNYMIANAEVSDNFVSLVNFVIEGHLEPAIWNSKHTKGLLMITGHLHELFYRFAEKNQLFKSLCTRDQTLLLHNNVSLYVQYILARYLAADTGMEQLVWLLGPNTPSIGKSQPLLG